MKGMILAAGRGQRMGGDVCKPLLKIDDRSLIEYRIDAFVKSGIRDIVINVHHFAEQIQQTLGDGARYGARFYYSIEKQLYNTGGGIYHALSLLGREPFIVTNADVWTDFPLATLPIPQSGKAHIVLVPNPEHHPAGDFALGEDGLVSCHTFPKYTFSGMSCLHPDFFKGCTEAPFGLGDWLQMKADEALVTGMLYRGVWSDVGTPERLQRVRESFARPTF